MAFQDGWRWCRRCQGLAHSAYGNGVCFDANGHDFSESGHYSVPVGALEGAQDGWRWCRRCQGLAHSAYGNGVCFDANGHDFTESGEYSVPVGARQGAQEGWRWCRRCQGLAHSAYGNGVCFDANGHDFSESGEYSVPLEDVHPPVDPPVEPTRPEPVIRVKIHNYNIEVEGEHFTPSGPVTVGFVRGSKVKNLQIVADERGAIYHYERDTVHGEGTVSVRDNTSNAIAFAASQNRFPRVVPDSVRID